MLTLDQAEMVAMKGKAVASLLELTSSLEECTTEDIGLAVYALECYFAEILRTLAPVNAGPQPS